MQDSTMKRDIVYYFHLTALFRRSYKTTMSTGQAQLLIVLAGIHPETAAQADLARLMNMPPSNISMLINALLELNVVVRRDSEVKLTESFVKEIEMVSDEATRIMQRDPELDLPFFSNRSVVKDLCIDELSTLQLLRVKKYIKDLKSGKFENDDEYDPND